MSKPTPSNISRAREGLNEIDTFLSCLYTLEDKHELLVCLFVCTVSPAKPILAQTPLRPCQQCEPTCRVRELPLSAPQPLHCRSTQLKGPQPIVKELPNLVIPLWREVNKVWRPKRVVICNRLVSVRLQIQKSNVAIGFRKGPQA